MGKSRSSVGRAKLLLDSCLSPLSLPSFSLCQKTSLLLFFYFIILLLSFPLPLKRKRFITLALTSLLSSPPCFVLSAIFSPCLVYSPVLSFLPSLLPCPLFFVLSFHGMSISKLLHKCPTCNKPPLHFSIHKFVMFL